MDTFEATCLSNSEKKVILDSLKFTLEKDNEQFFLTDENRRLLNNLIKDFSLSTVNGDTDKTNPIKKKLTVREFEIYCCVIKGQTNVEISGQLKISPNTVKVHINNMFKKLGVVNRWELISKFNNFSQS